MHPLLNIATTAARTAGSFIIRHLDQLDRVKVSAKSAVEYVTDVDVKAEQMIIAAIRKAYPDHGIIAEESGTYQDDAEVVWIIDPLDGTSNFIHGFPFYAVSIAVRVKNRIEHGVVFDPLRHECFAASRGAGAQVNDRRIRVSKQNQLSQALIGTGVPFRDVTLAERYMPTFNAMIGQCAGIRRAGAAALDLAYVAAGRLDGFWEFGLRPWDMAAGVLLIREAGGIVTDPQGGEQFLKTGDIVAGNPKVCKSLLQTIRSGL